jgi:hypothetical protein
VKDVYDPAQQSYRVAFACAVMLAGRNTTRTFDSCFEMGDGNDVAARIYRRALKNPRLMEVFPKYLDINLARENYVAKYGEPA